MNITEVYDDNGSDLVITSPWGLGTRVTFAVILAIIMAFSVVGNLMVIIVIVRHRGMRTRTNMFLCSLALADLFCGLLDMPIALVTVTQGYWVFGPAMCQINGFLVPFFFVASIHTLMYISIHKYVSIKWPFSPILTHRKIFLMILMAWSWAIVIGYTTIHGLNEVTYKPGTAQCGPRYPHDIATYFHQGLSYGTCYVIPLIIMVFCYITMFKEIRRHALRMELSTTTDRDVIFLQQRRITFTLFLVVVMFVVCWTPHVIYAAYAAAMNEKPRLHPAANPIVYWFGYLNSACNPIIYALRSPAFREGYRQLLCKGKQSFSSSDDYRDPYSQPLGRLRAFLKETLQGTLHASGSFTGTPAASPTGSRKSSMTSLTNFLLFPKTRTLSTNSLPGNFRFSVQPPIVDKDTTQVCFIAGIPVLTKGGKIVSYQNPHELPKRRTHPSYYPSQIQPTLRPSEKEVLNPSVSEKSPLIPHSHSDTKVPVKLSPHLEIPEIYINVSEEQVGVEPKLEFLSNDRPVLNPRNSCESGFNDVDHMTDNEEDNDDQVFIVVADIEPRPAPSVLVEPLEATTTSSSSNSHPSSPPPRLPAVLVSSCDLLSPPLLAPTASSITRQRVCKSVSDANERQRPHGTGGGRSSVKKSTSDTCIKQTKDTSTSCSDLVAGDERKKAAGGSHEKSIRKKFFNRIFSKTKQMKSTSSKSSSRSSQQDVVQRQIDDDVSDSGMVSGFSGLHESPSPGKFREDNTTTHHSFSGYDAKTRKAYTSLDREQKDEDREGGHKTLALSRSSSDPSLSQSQHHRHSSSNKRTNMKRQHRGVARSKNKPGHHDRSKRTREHEQNDYVMTEPQAAGGSHIQRSKSMKAGRYPSVEKLDRVRVGSDASALKKRVGRKVPPGTQGNRDNSHKTELLMAAASPVDVEQLKVFHFSEIKYLADRKLCHSISDPILTFKKIEEKVLQRSATKKWQRHKRPHRAKHTNTTGAATNMPRPHHDHQQSQHSSSSQASTSGNLTTAPRSARASNTPLAVDESLPLCQSNLSLDHHATMAKQPTSSALNGCGGDNTMSQSALSLHRMSVESCGVSFEQLGIRASGSGCSSRSGLSLNHLHTRQGGEDIGGNNEFNNLQAASNGSQVT